MSQETFKQRKFVVGPFVFTEAYEGVIISLLDCAEICINIGGSLPSGSEGVERLVASCFGRFSASYEADFLEMNEGWVDWKLLRSVQDAINEYKALVNDIETTRGELITLRCELLSTELLLRAKERALQVVEVIA